jgi:hypothetical protein
MSGRGGIIRIITPFYITDDGNYGYTPLERGQFRVTKCCPATTIWRLPEEVKRR